MQKLTSIEREANKICFCLDFELKPHILNGKVDFFALI